MQVKKGVGMEEALAEALASVNNLSRKKLLSELENLHRDVSAFRSPHAAPAFVVHPFLQTMKTATEASSATENNLTGMYMSYSCSSSMKALKAEPFYFTDSETYSCFTVGRKSVHNSIREGIGVVRPQGFHAGLVAGVFALDKVADAQNNSSFFGKHPFLERAVLGARL